MPVEEKPGQFRKIMLGGREFLTPVPPLTCPECGGLMVLKLGPQTVDWHAKHPVFYGCAAYPACRCTHGAHADGRPLGTPADAATKRARMAAHEAFDQLWKSRAMSRKEAYRWLRLVMRMTLEQGHIARFTIAECEELIGHVSRRGTP